MLFLIPLFYALVWIVAFFTVDGLAALSWHENLMRAWTGDDSLPILVNRVALGAAALAYVISWMVRLWKPKNPVL